MARLSARKQIESLTAVLKDLDLPKFLTLVDELVGSRESLKSLLAKATRSEKSASEQLLLLEQALTKLLVTGAKNGEGASLGLAKRMISSFDFIGDSFYTENLRAVLGPSIEAPSDAPLDALLFSVLATQPKRARFDVAFTEVLGVQALAHRLVDIITVKAHVSALPSHVLTFAKEIDRLQPHLALALFKTLERPSQLGLARKPLLAVLQGLYTDAAFRSFSRSTGIVLWAACSPIVEQPELQFFCDFVESDLFPTSREFARFELHKLAQSLGRAEELRDTVNAELRDEIRAMLRRAEQESAARAVSRERQRFLEAEVDIFARLIEIDSVLSDENDSPVPDVHRRLKMMLNGLFAAHNLLPFGSVGECVSFSSDVHTLGANNQLKPGAPASVVQPGWQLVDGGETILVKKARVREKKLVKEPLNVTTT